jgi:hypothetical protein
MIRTAWTLYDPITTETYFFPVNPYEDAGSFNIEKSILWRTNSGLHQDGLGNVQISNIVYPGSDVQERFSFVGKTYSLTDYNTLEAWVNKDYELVLTDDLGREFIVVFENIQVQRVRGSKNNRDKLSYTINGIVIENITDDEPVDGGGGGEPPPPPPPSGTAMSIDGQYVDGVAYGKPGQLHYLYRFRSLDSQVNVKLWFVGVMAMGAPSAPTTAPSSGWNDDGMTMQSIDDSIESGGNSLVLPSTTMSYPTNTSYVWESGFNSSSRLVKYYFKIIDDCVIYQVFIWTSTEGNGVSVDAWASGNGTSWTQLDTTPGSLAPVNVILAGNSSLCP